uniref:Uncharacterized protein n=1 Tax=Candidatus Methanogaster sp. ANME-2c ERB4 TaxID=2759911 RepID=A0A7G9Y1F1_9EURY|nr:hypothetical protein ADJAJEDA_00004 [Methanosarcinales archaeon ANME-2c ERB4]
MLPSAIDHHRNNLVVPVLGIYAEEVMHPDKWKHVPSERC